MKPDQIKYNWDDTPEFQEFLYMSLEGKGEEIDPEKYREGLRRFNEQFWGK